MPSFGSIRKECKHGQHKICVVISGREKSITIIFTACQNAETGLPPAVDLSGKRVNPVCLNYTIAYRQIGEELLKMA